jgi:hypothetical protein
VRRGRGVGIQVPPNRVALMTGGGNWLSFPGDCAIRVPEEGGRMRVWMAAGQQQQQQLAVYISQWYMVDGPGEADTMYMYPLPLPAYRILAPSHITAS